MCINKIIAIVGAEGLIGQAIVKELLEDKNITVIGLDIIEKDLQTYDYFQADITDTDSIQNVINEIDIKFSKLDVVINCAYPRSKNYGKSFFDVNYEQFCLNLDLHLGGYFNIMQLFAKYFLKQGYGNIINFASVYGVIAPRFDIYTNSNGMTTPIEYAAIKPGIINMTKYLSKYLKGNNIRVNAVSPGGILDNQPEGFLEKYNSYANDKGMLEKEDIVGTIKFLISDDSKYITGQNIIVDDGFSL